MLFLKPSYFLLFLLQRAAADIPAGAVDRTVKQQILATIPPGHPQSSVLFLTSPSGNYAAYFLRRETAVGAGGFGNEFCFVQVEDTATGESAWGSECTPVSTANTCSLVFDDDGLVVLEGSLDAWSTEADGFHLNSLQLVDHGDMWISDKDGELAWKASDMPMSNHGCGFPGSPGLVPESPPFAGPIGAAGSLPFELPAPASSPQLSAAVGESPGGATAAPVSTVACDAGGPVVGNYTPPPAQHNADSPLIYDGGIASGQPAGAPVDGNYPPPAPETNAGAPVIDNGSLSFGQPPAAPEDTPVGVGSGAMLPFGMAGAATSVEIPVGQSRAGGSGAGSPYGQLAGESEGRRPVESDGVLLSGQPLVDSTPYDSGCLGRLERYGVTLVLLALAVAG